jgi:hypothetical protein
VQHAALGYTFVVELAIAIVILVAIIVAVDVARTAPRPPPRLDPGEAITTTQKIIHVDLDRRP